jgi:hypothetical protein
MFKSGGNDGVINQGGAQTQTQINPNGSGGYTTQSNPDANAQAGSVVQQQGITSNNGKLPYFALNQAAFQNPVGNQAPAWQQGMNNYLGQTFGANLYQGAPQAQNTTLGALNTNIQAAQLGNANTMQAAQLNGRQYNQSYNQEQGLASQYGAMAAGNGPSLAAQTAATQGQQNIQAQMSALASQRGAGNAGLSAYNQQNQAAQQNQATQQQAVTGRTQEELGAMAAQGNVLGLDQ